MGIPGRKGPTLIIDPLDNDFSIVEGEMRCSVTPRWHGDSLHIGCTTVTREAFERMVEKFGSKS